MIELRDRPYCSDCEMPVSSHAEGCLDCGMLLLCNDCRDVHEMKHQHDDRPTNAETLAADQQPHFPHAGYTTAGVGGWLWRTFA